MAKLTLVDGTVFEGTTEEIFAITERYGSKQSEEPAKVEQSPAKEITHNGKAYELVDRKAQAGDVVVFTESSSSSVTNGKPYVVTGGKYSLEFADDNNDYLFVYNRPARSEANTLVYAPKVEPLKVGDYAVHEVEGWFKRGTVVKITELGGWGGSDDTRLLVSDGEKEFSVFKTCLRKATDEEVAKAEKDAVFTRLGRKPGEFKKGDIVRVIIDNARPHFTKHSHGDVGIVVEADSTDRPRIDVNGVTQYSYAELIAPVESRVDAS